MFFLDNSASSGRNLLIPMPINGRGDRAMSDHLGVSLLQVFCSLYCNETDTLKSYNEAAELCLLKYSVGWTLEPDDDFSSACLYGEHLDGYYMDGGDLEEC